MTITTEIREAALALRKYAQDNFVRELHPIARTDAQTALWRLGKIHPVTITFQGKMDLIGGKTFGAIAWTHWNGNQRYMISLPEYNAAAYHRLRKFVWEQTGYDPDVFQDKPVFRSPVAHRFTVDGMYNEVTPEFADMHPFGQRWLGLWEWDMPYQSEEWNKIHQVDWGAYRGEPRKYKERSFSVEAVFDVKEVV